MKQNYLNFKCLKVQTMAERPSLGQIRFKIIILPKVKVLQADKSIQDSIRDVSDVVTPKVKARELQEASECINLGLANLIEEYN
jgi:hypothetical protein